MSYIGNSNVENWSTPGVEYFSGDGTTTSFALTRRIYTFADIQVIVENVIQHPEESWTWDHTTNSIVFYEAPLPGTSNIYVRYNSRQTTIIAPGQGTVTSDSLSIGAPEWTPDGNVTVLGTLTVNGDTATVNDLIANNSITSVDYYGSGYGLSDINAANVVLGIVPATSLGTGSNTAHTFLNGLNSWVPVVEYVSTDVGFEPSTANAGTIIISGTLNTSNGGTGLTSFSTNGALYATDTETLTTGTLPVYVGGTGVNSLTPNAVVIGNGDEPVNTVSPGVANNILVSDGTNWVSGNAVAFGIGVTGGGGRGELFTANGTFTVPVGVSQVKVTVIGGGGGFIVSPNLQFGANGGDGGVAIKYVTGLTPGDDITVTVGTKGSSTNAYVGTASSGTQSSFGSYAVASGGGGAYYDSFNIAIDGVPGVGTTGDFSILGQKMCPINTSYYYGQGDRRGLTIPNGVVIVEY